MKKTNGVSNVLTADSGSVTNNWGRFKKQFEDRGLLAFELVVAEKRGFW